MFENKVLVKHKKLGYEGTIDGQTQLKMLFTGNKKVDFQYRVKIANQDKRFIAPEEDLRRIKVPIPAPKKRKAKSLN
jgi:hypothetical protein